MKTIGFVLLFLVLASCAKDGSDGAVGPIGPQGPTGDAGATGTAGTSDKVASNLFCAVPISGLTGAAGTALNGLTVAYSEETMESGDVFVSGNIESTSIQISGSALYSSKQTGAQSRGLVITDDFATPNGGYWSLSSNVSILTIVYTDNSLASQSPVTITSSGTQCTAGTF